jgi:hypothetical protein
MRRGQRLRAQMVCACKQANQQKKVDGSSELQALVSRFLHAVPLVRAHPFAFL